MNPTTPIKHSWSRVMLLMVLLVLGLLTSAASAQEVRGGGDGTDDIGRLIQSLSTVQQTFAERMPQLDGLMWALKDRHEDLFKAAANRNQWQQALDQLAQNLAEHPAADTLANLVILAEDVQTTFRSVAKRLQNVEQAWKSASTSYTRNSNTIKDELSNLAAHTDELERRPKLSRALLEEIAATLQTLGEELAQLDDAQGDCQTSQEVLGQDWRALQAKKKEMLQQAQATQATQPTDDMDEVVAMVGFVLDTQFTQTLNPEAFQQALQEVQEQQQSLDQQATALTQAEAAAHAIVMNAIENSSN